MFRLPFRRELLSTARFMVVGCGALGNEVLKNLALMGVGYITAVDFDIVEHDNLCKSVLFTDNDASRGRRKTDAAKDALYRLNSKVEVNTIFGDAAYDVGLGLWKEFDVVISCVDSRWARYCINRNCMRTRTPWVDGGITPLEGSARVFSYGENCYACNLGPAGLDELKRRMPCPGIVRRSEMAGKAATTILSASIIAAIEVQEALKLLHQKELSLKEMTSLCGSMFCYEGGHLSTRVVDFKAWDEQCPCHEVWEVEGRVPLSAKNSVAEVLSYFRSTLCCENVRLLLRDDSFVDYVVRKDNSSRCEVMLPGRAVESSLEKGPFSGLGSNALYQHEYKEIDGEFPYENITLDQIGIPSRDVLHLEVEGRDRYFEIN